VNKNDAYKRRAAIDGKLSQSNLDDSTDSKEPIAVYYGIGRVPAVFFSGEPLGAKTECHTGTCDGSFSSKLQPLCAFIKMTLIVYELDLDFQGQRSFSGYFRTKSISINKSAALLLCYKQRCGQYESDATVIANETSA